MKNELEILIEKFLRHELTSSEADHLEMLLNDPKNMDSFREQLQIHFTLTQQRKFHVRSNGYPINQSIKKKKYFNWKSTIKYAAVFIVILGVMSLFWNRMYITEKQNNAKVVYIETEDGKKEVLEINEEKKILNKEGQLIATKSGNLITYKADPKARELVYNTLNVPNGTIFKIVLSDGSRVELNAGSQLKYPVNFIHGKDRRVFIKGEAFFDISSDSLHPFIVNTEDFNVTVLGTKFNISAYDNLKTSSTVLLEGSVSIENHVEKKKLIPGEMASVANSISSFDVREVDSRRYTAWRKGITIFQNENFGYIMKTLERKYNVQFVNNYSALEKEIFTATIVEEDIEEVLTLFSKSRPFKYKIDERKITIYKK
jgi:hypothetical protein